MKQNHKAMIYLRLMGYPMASVRRALVELTGVNHHAIARAAGLSRPTVTSVIAGIRKNEQAQETMARLWGIPRGDLFSDVA